MKTLRFLTCAATIGLLAGCIETTVKEPAKPAFNVPANFQSVAPAGQAIQSGWLKTFNDPQLDKLVSEVLIKNFDLQIAAAKVDAAVAAARQAGAALTPAVNLGVQGGNQGNLDSGLNNDSSSVGTSLDVAWELDVWGRVRAGSDAATEELQASQLDYDYAKLSLAAQTAKAYFLAVEASRQQHLAKETVDNYTKTAEVVNAFFKEGMVGIQDVHLAKSEKANAEASLESAKAAELDALRSLEALLGRYPSAQVDVANDLPDLPAPIQAGIPSEVLERRPDIVAAERRVAAAFDKIKQAETAKLPKISLTGSLGGVGPNLADMVNPANMIWNAVTSLMFPIFDGGSLDAQVDAASATQKQALANYQKTALKAFGDIETALSNEASLRRQIGSLEVAYQEAQSAEEIGMETYKSGQGNLLDVQQLQRSSFSAQRALLKVEHDLLVQRVNLYLGLGGEI
jgi:NodT family efflux transporter outer membrane factor (OMF) lipoprotein